MAFSITCIHSHSHNQVKKKMSDTKAEYQRTLTVVGFYLYQKIVSQSIQNSHFKLLTSKLNDCNPCSYSIWLTEIFNFNWSFR